MALRKEQHGPRTGFPRQVYTRWPRTCEKKINERESAWMDLYGMYPDVPVPCSTRRLLGSHRKNTRFSPVRPQSAWFNIYRDLE
jgi:hypothetical protein